MLKRFALDIPTSSLTGWIMVLAAPPIACAAIILEHDQWRLPSGTAVFGLFYSVLVAFMFCYWAWNRLVLMVPVAGSSVSSRATPVTGVLSGMWLLGEPLPWREVAAGGFILGAITLVLQSREPEPAVERARADTG